jgi:hypothetical protein
MLMRVDAVYTASSGGGAAPDPDTGSGEPSLCRRYTCKCIILMWYAGIRCNRARAYAACMITYNVHISCCLKIYWMRTSRSKHSSFIISYVLYPVTLYSTYISPFDANTFPCRPTTVRSNDYIICYIYIYCVYLYYRCDIMHNCAPERFATELQFVQSLANTAYLSCELLFHIVFYMGSFYDSIIRFDEMLIDALMPLMRYVCAISFWRRCLDLM